MRLLSFEMHTAIDDTYNAALSACCKEPKKKFSPFSIFFILYFIVCVTKQTLHALCSRVMLPLYGISSSLCGSYLHTLLLSQQRYICLVHMAVMYHR